MRHPLDPHGPGVLRGKGAERLFHCFLEAAVGADRGHVVGARESWSPVEQASTSWASRSLHGGPFLGGRMALRRAGTYQIFRGVRALSLSPLTAGSARFHVARRSQRPFVVPSWRNDKGAFMSSPRWTGLSPTIRSLAS